MTLNDKVFTTLKNAGCPMMDGYMAKVEWLETKYIYITVDLVGTGSDEWEWQFITYHLTVEEQRLKRKANTLLNNNRRESCQFGPASYSGAYRSRQEAYIASINYAVEKILPLTDHP